MASGAVRCHLLYELKAVFLRFQVPGDFECSLTVFCGVVGGAYLSQLERPEPKGRIRTSPDRVKYNPKWHDRFSVLRGIVGFLLSFTAEASGIYVEHTGRMGTHMVHVGFPEPEEACAFSFLALHLIVVLHIDHLSRDNTTSMFT